MSKFTQDGKYSAKATGEVVLGKSANKGTPFIEFYFEVTKGELQGQKVRYTGYFTDNTAERTIESMRTCGWRGDDLAAFRSGKLNGLDSQEVEVVVQMEKFTNEKGEEKEAPRVAWVNSGGGYLNVEARMGEDDALSFGAKFNHLLARKPAPTGNGGPAPF